MAWLSDKTREQVKAWQRQLNQFTNWAFDHIEPLTVDGDVGPATRERVRDCKFWLGYDRDWIDNSVSDEFWWRLNHPNTVRSDPDWHDIDKVRVERGQERRKRERDRVDDSEEWAYCRGVTNKIIRIVESKRPGTRVTSRKRWETFGNPSSDHYAGNEDADAVDFARTNDQWLMDEVSQGLGGPSNVVDYQTFNITHNGRRFRVQLIAVTHGTGPHFHAGVKRIW